MMVFHSTQQSPRFRKAFVVGTIAIGLLLTAIDPLGVWLFNLVAAPFAAVATGRQNTSPVLVIDADQQSLRCAYRLELDTPKALARELVAQGAAVALVPNAVTPAVDNRHALGVSYLVIRRDDPDGSPASTSRLSESTMVLDWPLDRGVSRQPPRLMNADAPGNRSHQLHSALWSNYPAKDHRSPTQRDGALLNLLDTERALLRPFQSGYTPSSAQEDSLCDPEQLAIRVQNKIVIFSTLSTGLSAQLSAVTTKGVESLDASKHLAYVLEVSRENDMVLLPSIGVLVMIHIAFAAATAITVRRWFVRKPFSGASVVVIATIILCVGFLATGIHVSPNTMLVAGGIALMAHNIQGRMQLKWLVAELIQSNVVGVRRKLRGGRFEPVRESRPEAELLLRPERSVEENLDNVRRVMSVLPFGVLFVDSQNVVRYANSAAENVLSDCKDSTLIGSHLGTHLQPAPTSAAVLPRLQSCAREQYEALSQTGRRLWVSVNRISQESAVPAYAIVALHDVSALLENLSERDEMMRYFHHDLLSPLSAIMQATDASLGEAQQLNSLAKVRRYAERAIDISEQLIMYSKLAGVVAPAAHCVDVYDLTSQVADEIETRYKSKRTKVHVSVQSDLSIVGDYSILFRSLINLLDNAAKCGPPNATVELVVGGQRGAVLFSVRDRGPGIAVDLKQPTKPHSFGLGLRFVQKAAALHQGYFRLRNRKDGGAQADLMLYCKATWTKAPSATPFGQPQAQSSY